MGLKPLGDRVLILPIKDDEKIGMFFVPDSAREKPQLGRVVAKGEKAHNVEVDQLVRFGKYSGNDVKTDGVEYLLMREEDILAIETDLVL